MSSLTTFADPPDEPTVHRTLVPAGGAMPYIRDARRTADELVATLTRIHAEYSDPPIGLPAEVPVTIFVAPAVAAALWARMAPELEPVYAVDRCCRVCGCSDEDGCESGCWWVAVDLCSSCEGSVTP